MRVCESRIEAVRVYRVGATVRRRFVVSGGERELEVPGLPLSLDDATVRVRAIGAPGAPVPVDLRVGLHAKRREDAQVNEVERELEELRREQRRDESAGALLEAEYGLLESIRIPERPRTEAGTPPPAAPLEARIALDEFKHGELEKRAQTAEELEARMTDRAERIEELVDRLRRVSQAGKARADEVTKSVTVNLRGEIAQGDEVTYELEYYVPGARWAPQYQCRVDRDGERAVLQSRALVVQRTGEDWTGVSLELSTANALRFSELPELSSIRIGKAQRGAGPTPGFRPAPQGADAMFSNYDASLGRARVLAPAASVAATSAPYVSRAMDEDAFAAALRPHIPVVAVSAGSSRAEPSPIYDEVEEELGLDDDFAQFDAMETMAPSSGYGAPMAEPVMRSAPAAPAAPSPKGRARRAKKMAARPASQQAFGGAPGAAAGGAAADRSPHDDGGEPSLPRFGALRLVASTDTTRRGKLQPVDRRDAYAEALARSGREAAFDLLGVVRDASQRAAQAWNTAQPAGASDVAAESGAFDYVYASESRVEVASDGVYHSVPLGERDASCEMRYVVVPREESHVYRMATIENPSAAPMLAGPVEVYVGGAYVLSTRLPTVAPRERFKLGLGVEQAIKCARNARFEEKRTDSGVVATAELHHKIEIELVNNLGRKVRCEVRERIPQPAKNAEVVVDEGEVSPKWEEYTQRQRHRIRGGRRWDVEIDAGARRELRAEYVVKIYAQNEVVGGNRREE